MISPIARKLMRKRSATRAPITSEEAANVPQPKDAPISFAFQEESPGRGRRQSRASISLGRQVLSKNGWSGL